jgi:pyruvate dehydrogenase E1 component
MTRPRPSRLSGDAGAPDTAELDPQETREWTEAIEAVVANDGPERAQYLLERSLARASSAGTSIALPTGTPYVNTIPPADEPAFGGNPAIEERIRSLVRWNAMALVLQANKQSAELGGHIASYQSAATLYEVGFNHFWHAPSARHGGDLLYIQGHSSPGIYARAYLEGRISEQQMRSFRQEASGEGLSSYPHPWLMPEFWQFPTVSMGLGPIMAIHQARFMTYLSARAGAAELELPGMATRKVWAFMGDGEMDEPESLGAISLAGRERLQNLIFVINCNLQRLDGPVRGNGKVIQELESNFRGAGWNVIKLVWGSRWDPLLASPERGLLMRRMDEALDGDYQTYKSRDGAYVREHFFGTDPQLRELVAEWSDEQIFALNRGGHDPQKVYAAYAAAAAHTGAPTVILAKTIKGYGMGDAGEGQNITHQQKQMTDAALLAFRDRFQLPLSDEQAIAADFYRPNEGSPELTYLRERRAALGGSLPQRRRAARALDVPELSAFQSQLDGTGDRQISTTMAFVRILATLLRDKHIGRRVVPIVPDESRTFGMEGMFRQLGIFSQVGQLYQPEDSEQLMFYKEDEQGQILQEGINEPGAFSTWLAAATSYANHGAPMVPFYIYYSMFGFQRIGDLAWAAGDSRARGFLLGGTAGRTTLNGEGLQHEDGHSHLLASVIPNCRAYDPTFAYELAVIVQDGLRRMLAEQEDVFYYITVMNENYAHPALPANAHEGILRGMYLFSEMNSSGQARGARSETREVDELRVQLLGSGTILREVIAAAELLSESFGIGADVWSVTSFTELRREAIAVERWNGLHPTAEPRDSHVQRCLHGRTGPVIAASDYMRAFAEQIRPFVPARYRTLGTDGFGRSDYRVALRRFFEVDRYHIAVASLHALAMEGAIDSATVQDAIDRYGIDAEVEPPWQR